MNRSPFFYVGDKYKLMKQLKEYFPENINTLIEPFCGGGSVFLNAEAKTYLANDKNYYIIKLHKFLNSYKNDRDRFYIEFTNLISEYEFSASLIGKTVPNELKEKYKKTYYAHYNKYSYIRLRASFNENKEDFMSLYVLLIYGFNHMLRFNKSGKFNLPVGNVDYNKNVKKALESYFDFIENNHIEFYCYDYEEFLFNINYNNGDFIYLDPPYLISNCEYNKGWTGDNEKRLLEVLDILNNKGIKFALSNVLIHKGQSNDLLIEWSKKYHIQEIKSNYISYHDNTIKDTKEVLITNYKRGE